MRDGQSERSARLTLLPPSIDMVREPRGATQTLGVRIETSAAMASRILQLLRQGVGDFVLASNDGRFRARIRLTPEETATTEHFIGNQRILIDWSRGTVEDATRRTPLSRTELRLLAALLDGAGKVHSRRTLIERVWPGDARREVDRENALAVYICALRKRLATVGAGAALQTGRGAGYRLML